MSNNSPDHHRPISPIQRPDNGSARPPSALPYKRDLLDPAEIFHSIRLNDQSEFAFNITLNPEVGRPVRDLMPLDPSHDIHLVASVVNPETQTPEGYDLRVAIRNNTYMDQFMALKRDFGNLLAFINREPIFNNGGDFENLRLDLSEFLYRYEAQRLLEVMYRAEMEKKAGFKNTDRQKTSPLEDIRSFIDKSVRVSQMHMQETLSRIENKQVLFEKLEENGNIGSQITELFGPSLGYRPKKFTPFY